MLHRGKIMEGITSLCWNRAEYKTMRYKDKNAIFITEAFTKSHFINQGYLQLIKSNNPVYYLNCYNHIFLP